MRMGDGSGSCPVAGFGNSSDEFSGPAATALKLEIVLNINYGTTVKVQKGR
jgi:hypothetical protein